MTIIQEERKTLESDILVTFLLGVPKTMHGKLVSDGVEVKTEIYEVQLLEKQMELAAVKATNHSAVLQINEEAAAVTDKAITSLEEKTAALTGGKKRKKPKPGGNPKPTFVPKSSGTWEKSGMSRKPWGPPRASRQEGLNCFTCNSPIHLYAPYPHNRGRIQGSYVRQITQERRPCPGPPKNVNAIYQASKPRHVAEYTPPQPMGRYIPPFLPLQPGTTIHQPSNYSNYPNTHSVDFVGVDEQVDHIDL